MATDEAPPSKFTLRIVHLGKLFMLLSICRQGFSTIGISLDSFNKVLGPRRLASGIFVLFSRLLSSGTTFLSNHVEFASTLEEIFLLC